MSKNAHFSYSFDDEIESLYDKLFGDGVDNAKMNAILNHDMYKSQIYGKEADQKLFSFAALSELQSTFKKMILNLNKLRNQISPIVFSNLINDVVRSVSELEEKLQIRLEYALNDNYDQNIRSTDNLDILRAMLVLNKLTSDKKDISTIYDILSVDEDSLFSEEVLKNIIRYHRIKKKCIFPNIVDFLDKYLDKLWKNAVYFTFVIKLLEQFTDETITKPYPIGIKLEFEYQIPNIKGCRYFEQKDEISLAKIINAIFLLELRVIQIDIGQSYVWGEPEKDGNALWLSIEEEKKK